MNVRERTEEIEFNTLSPFAALAKNSKGRSKDEQQCDIRTVYQIDRDRIIHSKSFRRLKHKTQMFISPEGDHYRTRLTHTLEVSQIARTIARGLRFNEDLVEAVSLGHDIGHTPFGHAGERVLNDISSIDFKHYEQSVRVLERLEKNGRGLNITEEVRDGIICHTRGKEADTVEGRIVKIADRIAYVNHDIDDAIRANVLKNTDIPKYIVDVLGDKRADRINTLVSSIVNNSVDNELRMSEDVSKAFDELHNFMHQAVYVNHYAKAEESKVPMLIGTLYKYFKNNYKKMPDDMQLIAQKDGIDRAICDYIAGMTDPYAIQIFECIFIPKSWKI